MRTKLTTKIWTPGLGNCRAMLRCISPRSQKTLAQWRADPDLAGLREPAALDRFPAAEREEYRRLWRGVDDVIKRSQAPK
jgi:hypothetical protein